MNKSYLKQFREDNIGELDTCLKVACTIRDSKVASSRDKNEAIKIIARLLSALQPDRTVSGPEKVAGKVKELDPKLLKRIKDEYTPEVTKRVDESTEDSVPEGSL